ncbi:hypothetical protein HMI54_002003 [Coelomomyces lativittatus]|nr:hypothetical protein HMI54_002003 [Coelomomyces lativittatus]KAJ1510272.1 hypothetical protein HMI55_007063 [Coelomomyces lativittatus]KAJ1514298.1 hypothetical protein HMI56_000746 [Coelomomyces lativittatus]
MTTETIEPPEKYSLDPFTSWQEIRTALGHQDAKSIIDGCHRLKEHLRSLFNTDHLDFQIRSQIIIQYLQNEPDLTQIWSIFQFTLSFRNLYPLVMDILGLLLSCPINYQKHRQPLFLHLLKNFKPTLLTRLHNLTQIQATISTIRTLTLAVEAGFFQELCENEFFIPFPKLAGSMHSQFSKKKNSKQNPSGKSKGTRHFTTRHFYVRYVSALIKSGETSHRQSIIDNNDFLRPALKNLEFDTTENLKSLFSALEIILNDMEVTKTSKVSLFTIVVLEGIRKLYSEVDKRDLAHSLLKQVCTVPGQVLCFKDYGLYPPPSHTICNKQLSIFIFKLNVFEPMQQELLFSILKSCPELVRLYSEKTALSLDPKASQRWVTTVQFTLNLLNLPFPTLKDSKNATLYSSQPPLIFTFLAHIAPLSLFNRDIFARGYSMASPVVLFFTARLMVSVLENVKKALSQINHAISWWENNGLNEAVAWNLLKVELLTETAKQMVDFQIILKCIHSILGYLSEDRFPQRSLNSSLSSASTANKEEDSISKLESDLQPSMIYLCMLRILSLYAELFPEHITMFDTGKLIHTLPPTQIIGELLNTLIQWPPLLTSKSLSSLLKLHASKSFLEQTTPLLEKMLSTSALFAPCPQEVQWWLLDFPQSMDFLIFFSNLFGESTQHLFSLQNTLLECVENKIKQSPFSFLAIALVQKLCRKGVDSFSSVVLSSCFSILRRIRAIQPSPEAFEALLVNFNPPLCIPDEPERCLHPFIAACELLQVISTTSSEEQNRLIIKLSHHLDSNVLDSSSTLQLFSHPSLKSCIFSVPQAVSKLLVKHLAPFTSDNQIKLLLNDFFILFQRSFLETQSDFHCDALAVFSKQFQLTFSLDLNLIHQHHGIRLAPFIVNLPIEIILNWMNVPNLSIETHQFILQVLLSRYPLLHHSLVESLHKLSIDQIPESYLLQLLSLDPTCDSSIRDLVQLFMLYSKKHYLKTLEYLESSSMPEIHFKLLISASVVVLEHDSKLHWLEHAMKPRILSLAKQYVYLLREKHELDLRVALVLLEAITEESEISFFLDNLTLDYNHLVRGWYSCTTDILKLNFFHRFAQLIIEKNMETGHFSNTSALFLLQIIPFITFTPDYFSNFGVEFLLSLIKFNTLSTIRLLLSLLSDFLANHTPGQAQILLQALFDTLDTKTELFFFHLKAISQILMSSPENHCKQDYFFKLRSNYQATLHPSDLIIYDLFMLFERKASTNLGPHLLFWGATANDHTNLIEASFTLIDATLMYTTIQYFPQKLFLATPYLEQYTNKSKLFTASMPKKVVKFPYDPRFFLFLTIKYLEQGNSIDLQVLLEKHLIGLAIVSLCSEDANMRSLGLRILDEFYNLIATSNLQTQSSLYLLLDYLKFSIQDLSPEPTKLPRLLSTFLAFSLPILQHPEQSLYDSLHRYLLSQPTLDTTHFPLLRAFLMKSGDFERTWILSLFIGCTDDPIIRPSVWDWFIGYSDLSTLSHDHHLSCIRILIIWSIQVSVESLFSSGVLPYFHHIAYTSSHPKCLLALARGLAIIYPRLVKNLRQQQFHSLAQALVHQCQTLSIHPEHPWTLEFCFNMADALVRIDQSICMRQWVTSLLKKVCHTVFFEPDISTMDWFDFFHISTQYSSATFSILEHEIPQVHPLVHSCIRKLASFSPYCYQLAVTCLKNPEFLLKIPDHIS